MCEEAYILTPIEAYPKYTYTYSSAKGNPGQMPIQMQFLSGSSLKNTFNSMCFHGVNFIKCVWNGSLNF